MSHDHHWLETGVSRSHAYGSAVIYLECSICNQRGFRKPEHQVVYTWEQESKGTGSKT